MVFALAICRQALVHYTNSAACKVNDDDSSFLLSVYEQYLKDKKISGSESASKTLMQAFRRALECKK